MKDFLEFGPFRADVRGRLVLRQGELVPLPGKAFEVLLVLLQKQGETVSKDELMKAVWPDTFVEEGNLTQTIFVLRKALGDAEGQSFIITIPRQGYRFASEVRRLSDPESAGRAKVPGQTAPPLRSVQWSWLVAGMLAVLGATGWWYALRAPKTVPSPLMSLSLDLGPDALSSTSRLVTVSPDGTRVVFRIRRTDGKTMLAVRSLDLPSSRSIFTPLPGTVDATERFFSPDGQWLAFVAGRKLRKIPMQGGAPSTICDVFDFAGGSWGENNQIIAVLGSAVGLFRIDARGGTPQLLAKPADHKEAVWAWPQILPGGDAVIYTANKSIRRFDEASIEVLSLKSRQWKTLQRGAYYGRYLSSGHLVWVRNRTLFGARFDPVRLEMRSTPVPVIEEDLASMPDWGAGQFDFSDTGTLVYGSGDAQRSIVWMDSEGKTQPLIATPARYRDPSLSPDGKRLAVATGIDHSEIMIFDLERRAFSQRTFMKDCRIPAWTSDGRHILFACTADKEGTIWWVRADGSGEPYALYKAPGSVERFSLSPDGRTLLAVTHENEILSIALDTTDPDHPKTGMQELLAHRARHGSTVAFSPDGRWIAYSNHDEGESGIYVRPAAVESPGKWQISLGPGRHPIWRRGVPQLLYQDTEGHILVMDYTTKGETFSPGKTRLWVDKRFALGVNGMPGRVFDLAPDGKHIVAFLDPVEDEGTVNHHVTFLVNFFDELRRRIPEAAR